VNGRIRDHILRSRYLQPGEEGFPDICSRVASAIGSDEVERDQFLRMLQGQLFLPNSPALMNAGTRNPQLSACFVIPVGDTIPEIFRALREGAIIQVNDGGTGYSFSEIPPSGAPIGDLEGASPGPVRIMEIFDTATRIIREGGRRRGANMGILDITHPDILSFITAKKEEGVLENFNISVMIPDRYMKALTEGSGDEILTTHPVSGEAISILPTRSPERRSASGRLFHLLSMGFIVTESRESSLLMPSMQQIRHLRLDRSRQPTPVVRSLSSPMNPVSSEASICHALLRVNRLSGKNSKISSVLRSVSLIMPSTRRPIRSLRFRRRQERHGRSDWG